ncbi:MAG: 16S rRNA (adenine(1518)-N(6)/adenine(1519)-N(6))-dimethyltransferase RsmA [Hyphomonadaceae bacterium]|nr:16S rRNA (adenine(1518)-N(6)/adenine(1519)-N(6))-dimethyltransferase RsmA [Hyphomonadaceae bacterium]
MNADELPALRDELEAHGLWANKGLGQHFLLDLNITRRIARTAGDLAERPVIEVGPGPGGLTRALLEAGAHVTAIEKDARFLPLLEPLIAWSEGRLSIVQGDALEVNECDLVDDTRADVISNLPYNVGTPLLVKWLKAGSWRGNMTLMFQKEVAQRIVAKPRSDAYGRLAVLAQARCNARLEFTVPARAFTPPPKIASAIVRLTDLDDPYPHLDALERVTAAAFGQRRKMLRSALRALTPEPEPLLLEADINPTARAEEIDQMGFRRLTEAWRAASP